MLHIFYGRAGSGKTEKLMEIARSRADGPFLLYLTPETASHMTERRAAAGLGDRASLSCEVVTFRRLTHQIFAAAGGLAVPSPDDGARMSNGAHTLRTRRKRRAVVRI